jgi:ATP-dependent Clp protease ATP-binding subunit ClpB
LTQHFRPEFLNRIDEIVIFNRLTQSDLKQIADLQLERVRERLLEQGYHLQVSDGAKAFLAEVGYDPVYGARPLKRTIQRELQDPLSLQILSGDFHPGDIIAVEREGDHLAFHQAGVSEVEPA